MKDIFSILTRYTSTLLPDVRISPHAHLRSSALARQVAATAAEEGPMTRVCEGINTEELV